MKPIKPGDLPPLFSKQRWKPLRYSKSSIGTYQTCPRQFFYSRQRDIPKRTDYPRLCGNVVHELAEKLYKPTKDPRPFFFREKKGLLGYFWFEWQRQVKKATQLGTLIDVNEDDVSKFLGVGTHCLSNYWNANFNLPRPLQIEQAYRATIWDCKLIGIFDQLRAVSIEYIQSHRPELVQDGILHPKYDPVIIVDLKTEYESYDVNIFRNNPDQVPTLMQKLRKQFELHEGLQATMYTLLYELKTGKKPIGFVWYHLPSNKWFFTYRTNRDYDTFYDVLMHVRDNIAAQSFPKHVGKACKRCDYVKACREDRYFIISRPEIPGESEQGLEFVPNPIEKSEGKQLSMRLGIRRKKREMPEIIVPVAEPTLHELPWDGGPRLTLPLREDEEEIE